MALGDRACPFVPGGRGGDRPRADLAAATAKPTHVSPRAGTGDGDRSTWIIRRSFGKKAAGPAADHAPATPPPPLEPRATAVDEWGNPFEEFYSFQHRPVLQTLAPHSCSCRFGPRKVATLSCSTNPARSTASEPRRQYVSHQSGEGSHESFCKLVLPERPAMAGSNEGNPV